MSNVLGNCQECGEMKPCDCGFGGFNADADPTPAEALKACPFCAELLTIRGGVNAYGRCDTEGCWMHDRMLTVPLCAPAQVAAWNQRPDAGEVRTYREGVSGEVRECVRNGQRC